MIKNLCLALSLLLAPLGAYAVDYPLDLEPTYDPDILSTFEQNELLEMAEPQNQGPEQTPTPPATAGTKPEQTPKTTPAPVVIKKPQPVLKGAELVKYLLTLDPSLTIEGYSAVEEVNSYKLKGNQATGKIEASLVPLLTLQIARQRGITRAQVIKVRGAAVERPVFIINFKDPASIDPTVWLIDAKDKTKMDLPSDTFKSVPGYDIDDVRAQIRSFLPNAVTPPKSKDPLKVIGLKYGNAVVKDKIPMIPVEVQFTGLMLEGKPFDGLFKYLIISQGPAMGMIARADTLTWVDLQQGKQLIRLMLPISSTILTQIKSPVSPKLFEIPPDYKIKVFKAPQHAKNK